MYYCCGVTEKGVMTHNEDALLINDSVIDAGSSEQMLSEPFIAAVSDGVSGERSGELASKMCLELVRDIRYGSECKLDEELLAIHYKLAEYSESDPEMHNMQATLCGIAIDEKNNILTFNVGDSRLYRFRGGRIKQLSRDQSLVQLLIDEGTITREERKSHVHRNIIFPVFGNVKSAPKVDTVSLDGGMEYGDLLLLCTDGLSDYVSVLDIEEILEMPKSLKNRLHLLVNKALENGSKDNITVIAIVYQE
ncbi:MAG: protein phosphatase 2C domain-containing protein [Ruminococcus sp.]|uniref:PP2C family protein-serine/threonine phosphatase n=1 Tax=Ruminococcus sp. TaxID=41978 RepID=UPI0025E3E22A|nr:protein phosphatase 2C domain-containing protein [Ruminococcus sp.]MCR5599965.1 protein phosphatase 2C domain-containing protein [Ruminococcus sp.]